MIEFDNWYLDVIFVAFFVDSINGTLTFDNEIDVIDLMIGLDHNVTNIKKSRLQLYHDFLYKQFWGAYFSDIVIKEEPHRIYLLIKHFENEMFLESRWQFLVKL